MTQMIMQKLFDRRNRAVFYIINIVDKLAVLERTNSIGTMIHPIHKLDKA